MTRCVSDAVTVVCVMDRLDDLAKRLESLSGSLGGILRDTMRDDPLTGADIVARQKEQLYAGLASSGDYLRPTMDQDSYFKTHRDFMNYAVEKRRRFAGVPGEDKRPLNVPNLNLYSGLFHSGFFVDFREDEVQVDNNQLIRGVDVYAKYGAHQFGLTDENWEGVMAHVIPQFVERIKENIGV